MSGAFHADRSDGVARQRAYYATTAGLYDEMHQSEHKSSLAMPFFLAALDHLGISSILDVCSGTGVALMKIKDRRPHIAIVRIEPVSELRRIGHAKGLSEAELIGGDATNLPFEGASLDLVCEFATLHHIPEPSRAVAEMLRVARKAIFICDSNNFG